MTKKQKNNLISTLVSLALLILLHFVNPQNPYLRFALYMIPYLTVGYDILRKALLSIKNREHFDENFLMAIASIGAIALQE